ncbi:hypothetical protein GCM10011367_03780 [Marinicauda pacifica]|nr:hypothetical protein GCM10011367_03780 [Marinicauda pacifica]
MITQGGRRFGQAIITLSGASDGIALSDGGRAPPPDLRHWGDLPPLSLASASKKQVAAGQENSTEKA